MLALTADDPSLQPGFEDVDTSVQACVPHYGVYDFTAESGEKFAQKRIDTLLRKYVMARRCGATPTTTAPPPRCTASRPTRRRSSSCTAATTRWSRWPRRARSSTALRATSKNPVAYAEIAGAQHAFDIFPSFRSTGVVRGVARFLEWCHATRSERPVGVAAEA